MGWFSKSTDDFFLSTTTPPNIGIDQYVGVVNGEAIIGANIFRDMFSSVRDVVGGRAGGYERALSGARDAALEDMIEAAKERGANGVIGIDCDYEVLGETNGMMMVAPVPPWMLLTCQVVGGKKSLPLSHSTPTNSASAGLSMWMGLRARCG